MAKSTKMVQSEGKETLGQGLSKRRVKSCHWLPVAGGRASFHPIQSLVQEPAGTQPTRPHQPASQLSCIFHLEFRGQGKTGSLAQSRRLPFYSTKSAGGWGTEAPGSPGKEKSGGWVCPGDPITLMYKKIWAHPIWGPAGRGWPSRGAGGQA